MNPIYKRLFTIWVLLWGCSLVVFVILYVSLLEPQNEALEMVDKKLTAKKQDYEEFKGIYGPKGQVKHRQRVNRLNEKLNSFVTEPGDLDDLTFRISRIVNEIGVQAFGSNRVGLELYSEIPNCSYIGSTEVVINFKSPFNRFAKVINALERHNPVIFIDEFQVNQSKALNAANRANLVLKIFVKLPQEAEAGKVSAVKKD